MPWLAACSTMGNTPAATTSCTPLLTPYLLYQHPCVSLSYYILCFLLGKGPSFLYTLPLSASSLTSSSISSLKLLIVLSYQRC
jgi:hypothetical protein